MNRCGSAVQQLCNLTGSAQHTGDDGSRLQSSVMAGSAPGSSAARLAGVVAVHTLMWRVPFI